MTVLKIGGQEFPVEIQKKKMKTIRMRLKGNTLHVSAPFWVSERRIEEFILGNTEWILKTYKKMNDGSLMYRGGDVFYIFGKEYKLVFSLGKNNVSIREDTVFLTYKEEDQEKAVRYLYKYLDKYVLDEARKYLEKYRGLLLDYGYHQEPELKVRVLKSKWGVCYTRQNRIHVSSYLIHYPLRCLEYIVLHEVTHFLIPNHSGRFYDIVSSRMPDYKEVLRLLK